MKKQLLSILAMAALTMTAAAETLTFDFNQEVLGKTSTSYVTTAWDFTVDATTFSINNMNPKSGQARANQGTAAAPSDANWWIYNTTALSNISKVEISGVTYQGTGNLSLLQLAVGDEAISLGTAGAAATYDKDAGTLTWTPAETGKSYFRISMPKVGGTLKFASMTITYGEGGTPTPQLSEAGLAWSVEKAQAIIGETFDAPTLANPNNLAVTYSSSNPTVATIDAQGVVTILTDGRTTISASSEQTDAFKAGEAQYVLTVVDPKALKDEITAESFELANRYAYVTASTTFGTYNAFAYKGGDETNGWTIQLNINNSNNTNKAGMFGSANKDYKVKGFNIDSNFGSKGDMTMNVFTSATAFTDETDFAALTLEPVAVLSKANPSYTFSEGITNWAIVPVETYSCQVYSLTVKYEKVPEVPSAVELINADSAVVEYYNLQGVRVLNPLQGQLYIKHQSEKASKVIF